MKKKTILVLLCIILTIVLLLFLIIEKVNKKDENVSGIVNLQNNINNQKENDITTEEEQETILNGNFGEINRIFKDGSITNTSATILLINRTNIKFNYMLWFTIEKKENNEWIEVELKNDNDISSAFDIMPNTSVEAYLDWSKYYGILEKRRV